MLEEVVSVQWSGDVESPAKIKSTRRPAWRKQFLSGEQRFMHGEVNVYIVDERCPGDRVYQWTEKCTDDEIKAVLGDSPIGKQER